VMLRFKTPFWVEKGFCGLVQSFKGPAAVIRDTSVPSNNIWVLTCFLAGHPGEEWSKKPEQERTDVLITQVGEVWQNATEARESFIEQLGHEWSKEEYSGFGCPCPSLGPGVLGAAGHTLREPFKNVHFASTETAMEWKGYMEGAVRSGDRAGDEVVSCLEIGSKL
jgi:monoamine oxidase